MITNEDFINIYIQLLIINIYNIQCMKIGIYLKIMSISNCKHNKYWLN